MTHEWMRAVMAIAGALSIYLGYRLFCDVSHQKSPRLSVFVTHMASGAMLALFGLAILIADVREMGTAARSPRVNWQKKSSAHGSFEAPKFNRVARSAGSPRLI
jgi:hypothetical protein